MQGFTSDLRHSIRTLATRPGFTFTAILTLALGIGSSTAIFTVVNSVLLRPLPFPEPNRLVQLWEISDKGDRMAVPEANFLDWKQAARSFESMAMFNSNTTSILGGNEPVRAHVSAVSQGFFDVMGVQPMLGRPLASDDARPGSQPVVVVSFGFWQRVLGASDRLDQRNLSFLNKTFSIVAVMPAGFGFPAATDLWVAQEIFGAVNPSRSAHNWRIIARLKPEISVVGATAELRAIARRIHEEYRDVTAVDAAAVPLHEQLTQKVRTALHVLLGAVLILLFIACANVSSLLLAQSAARQKELAVRSALGASRGALVRLFLTQSLMLVGLGALLGVPLAATGVQWLLALNSGNFPRLDEIRVDGWVLGFAILLSVLVGIVVGVVPALRASRSNLDDMLKQAAVSVTRSIHHRRTRSALLVAQVAMTIMLLVGAGLLARSFLRILEVDLGFQTESRLAIDLLLPDVQDDSARSRMASLYQQLIERISSLPGVKAVGGAKDLPLTGYDPNGRFTIEGGKDSRDYWPNYRVVARGYFEAMGIPLLRGRLFDSRDGALTPQVALISQAVAMRVWPGENPIGNRINYANMDGDPKFMTIVGIVGDVRVAGPERPVLGEVYVHYLQRGVSNSFSIVVHHTNQTASLTPAIKSMIQSLDSDATVRFRTLDQITSTYFADRRFNLTLLSVLGGAALLLALAGVYGLTAYSVAQRTKEIGIRMALGARPGRVVRMFVADGSILVSAGIVTGILGSLVAARMLSTLLYQISPADPFAYAVVALSMFAISILAAYFPARSATKVDPMIIIKDS